MRCSLLLPATLSVDCLAAEARRVEVAGYDGIWLPDHLRGGMFFMGQPWYGCLTSLTTVVNATTTLRCGALVASAVLRPAATLALELSTLAAVGRNIFAGVGRGNDSDTQMVNIRRPDFVAFQDYVKVIQSVDVQVVVAADIPQSLRVAVNTKAHWVTNTGLDVPAKKKLANFRQLHRLWTKEGGRGDVFLLINPGVASPWKNTKACEELVRCWAEEGVDELVFFPPRVYRGTAGISYEEAVQVCHTQNIR